MWLFIQQIIQLLLSPARGWEDISAAVRTPDRIMREGFYPWLAIVGLSEFLRLFHEPDLSFFNALLSAIAVAGALFASLFLARLFLDLTLLRQAAASLSITKINVFAIYLIALEGLFIIFSNAMPASMTFIHFLPLISLLVIFKGASFVGIPAENTMNFLGLSVVALIALPIAMEALLSFIV